jgi:cation transport protein ChaC
MAYRLPADGVDAALMALIKREMPFVVSDMSARWMRLKTGEGRLDAVGFPVKRGTLDYVSGLSEEQVVTSLATAAGTAGSMAEYLLNTITHLKANGIHDRTLWHLQDRVATRLEEISARDEPCA